MRVRTLLSAVFLLAGWTMSADANPRHITTQWTNPTEAGVAWDSGPYLYDRSGNIAAIGKDLFAYDGANRLTSSIVHAHGVATSQSFDFDRYSNLLAMTTSIGRGLDWTHPFTATLDVDATTNQVREVCSTPPCREFEYDAAGNQTQFGAVTYSWDATGAMTELTAGTTQERYVYDANGERILTVSLDGNDAEVVRRWTWRDATNEVAREAVEHVGAGMWSEARDYVHRNGSLLASFDSATSTLADRHYHLDHLGTPRLTTDVAGNELSTDVYLPFGGRAAGTDTDVIGYKERLRFTGHERDGENSSDRPVLDYMHARYYTPQWGRFLSVDPGKDWNPKQPQSWNMYSYVRNNPLIATDPTGRTSEWSMSVISLTSILDRFKPDIEQLNKAAEAMKQIPVFKLTSRYGPPGAEIHAGRFQAGVTLEGSIKVDPVKSAVTAEVKGLIGGGVPGGETRIGIQAKFHVYGDGRVLPNGFDVPTQIAGQLGAMRANESEVTVRIGAGVTAVETGFDYGKAGEAVGRTLLGVRGIVEKLSDPVGLVSR